MMSRGRWLLTLIGRKLWLRVTLMAMIGIATAAAGIVFAPYVSDEWTLKIGSSAIDGILNVLASSMLAVTVFSMSTMVAAFGAATNNGTPRATKLLMEDQTSQNVLGTFIGSFLFSLVGIVALGTGLYGSQGRAILLVVTVVLIAVIAVTILRWIDYLARFGRLGETISRVEDATWKAMETRIEHPHLGGQAIDERPGGIPCDAERVFSGTVGYVQHVDAAALQAIAEAHEFDIFITALPGAFADPSRPIAMVVGLNDDRIGDAIASAFTVGAERTFDQDPRFGLCVLSEIASRALSPAVNDPGTAIDVIGRAVRLFVKWGSAERAERREPECPRVWVPPLTADDMFADVFAPIARDGAGVIEVQIRLQKAFLALVAAAPAAFCEPARRQSDAALRRALASLEADEEKSAVRVLNKAVHERAVVPGRTAHR